MMREKLLAKCADYVEERVSRLQSSIKDLEHDLGNETKSSAGDKYETSREMMNTEINKLQNQLQSFKKLKEVLAVIENRNNGSIRKYCKNQRSQLFYLHSCW